MNSNGVEMENYGAPSAAAAMSGSMLLEDHFDAIKYCRNSNISTAATCYSKYAKHQKAVAFEMLAENYQLISALPVGSVAVDLGCGTGEVTKLLTYFTNLGDVVGIDHSHEMLAVADCFNDDLRLRFLHGDMQQLSCNADIKQLEGRVGLVTAFAVLHWAPDQTQALRSLTTLLRPGGKLIAHVLARYPRSHADLHAMLVQSTRWKKYLVNLSETEKFIKEQPWMSAKNPAQMYKKLLEAAGLKVEKCELRERMRQYYSEPELMGYVQSFALKYIGSLANDVDYRTYLSDCFQAFSSRMKKQGDYYAREDDRIIVVATKS